MGATTTLWWRESWSWGWPSPWFKTKAENIFWKRERVYCHNLKTLEGGKTITKADGGEDVEAVISYVREVRNLNMTKLRLKEFMWEKTNSKTLVFCVQGPGSWPEVSKDRASTARTCWYQP